MHSQTIPLPPSNSHRLILEDVHVWRGDTTILQGINWQVQRGEHWAVLGANGSGKTSLMMTLSGYLPFGRGRIFLLDGWIGKINLPAHRKRIGIVSQPLSEYIAEKVANCTALEVVLTGLFGSLRLVDAVSEAQRQQAQALLAELGCGGLADKPFKLLSTGQRQLCLLARSKMAQNELVLLDEPCAGLDLGARERFLSGLEGLLQDKTGPTILFITHHPEEIVAGITHVLFLRAGKMVAAGPKTEMMTSALLSQTFDLPLHVQANNGRYWVQVRR